MSQLFKLNSSDFTRGLIVAVLAAVVAALAEALKMPNFDFLAYDWTTLLNVALTAGLAYLAKNFLTTENGKFGGVL
jgi:hypothetical protein